MPAYFTPSSTPRRLGGSASGGGGGVRISANAVRESTKEPMSIAYAAATLAAAMTTPASAGPAICDTLASDQLIAVAALSSSRSTSRGNSASKGGRRTAMAAANRALAT